jgi:predicted RNase H-like HicB family nuclease
VIIYPGEDGYWVAECPSLPGCISQGKTREEAMANIKEAIRVYVAALEEDNLWREHILGRYLRHKISRDEVIEAVGIDWVELAERQHEAMMEDLAWALGE